MITASQASNASYMPILSAMLFIHLYCESIDFLSFYKHCDMHIGTATLTSQIKLRLWGGNVVLMIVRAEDRI